MEELKMEDLFDVNGGMNQNGRGFFKRCAIEVKRSGQNKEAYLRFARFMGPGMYRYYDTSEAELIEYLSKVWDETKV